MNEDDIIGDEEIDNTAVKEKTEGCNMVRKGLSSVQDLLGEPLKEEIFGADEVLLHGSGREDIDVRMLGRGRPFILEFKNPKKGVSCYQRIEEMQKLAN